MLQKDVTYARNSNCLARHPSIRPKMRSILLSWLTEVSEAYKLHRETYYLAVDILDRYFATSKQEIVKNNLQLIGITALFIAAKIEEIYPPKLREFAYVTDGACLVEEIRRMELVMLGTLNWQLCPLTAVGWLGAFLQVVYLSDLSDRQVDSVEMVKPKYSGDFFACISQILDFVMLDIESLKFPYSHLAASALFHMSNYNVVRTATGFSLETLQPCVEWMRPYVDALFERGFSDTHQYPGIPESEQHTIQQHCVDNDFLNKVQEKIAERRQKPKRDLFAGPNASTWHNFVESPMRTAIQQQMPLTPMCTPPDDRFHNSSKPPKPVCLANNVTEDNHQQGSISNM